MVSSIAGPIFTYLERFLIVSFLSIGALTFYAIPYDILSRVVILPASIATTLFPVFSFIGVENRETAKELLSRSFKYLLFFITPVTIIFIMFAPEILELWLGKEFAQKSAFILQILAITFFLHVFAYTPLSAIQGLGRPDLKAKLDLVMLPSFVGFCWWFIPMWGLIGAAFAKLLVTIIDVLYLSWRVKGLLKLSVREMLGERGGKAVIIASLLALAVFSFKITFNSLLAGVAILSVFIPVYIILFFKVVMDDKDKSIFRSIGKYFPLVRKI